MLSPGPGPGGVTHCGVWGSPIDHSLSPVLHRAAYAALGLDDWVYERREVAAAGFAAALRGLDASWRGLSLTMPLKEVALGEAVSVSTTARETGAVNTLVRHPDGWRGHNTDVHGIVQALREAGCRDTSSALVIGSGATARSAVAALARSGTRAVTFMVRGRARPETVAQARASGLHVEVARMGDWAFGDVVDVVDVVVSTVPPSAVPALDSFPMAHDRAARRRTVLDVVYGQGETPLQAAARARGWTIARGVDMLLHQATEQVELMTGRPAPLPAMRDALERALAERAGGRAG
ncbi:shikimate dehydrogenase [Intrasporangium oryzae NRRL B-24470]|uniref:Shikimate dehydrogenase n=1 Tax=Intrasporangium oryzae NRRL B-24470 TaxID=1386089 RepID=W9GGG2_9MICO|nr:shikimate dehydrogenase [Intrasporangium oryzae]EWT02954.1 shikimate dehydrogenase [Intrasporangium oryzae NRRL B-24470]